MQRHWLAERITDDCPRCGWHGYFHHYLATLDRDWSNAICDNCYADLHPAITVTVRYFSACSPLDGEPVAVIRQRTRSDYEFPDLGQMLTWRLSWQHTTMLIDDRRGNWEWDLTGIEPPASRADRRRAGGPPLAAGRGPAAPGRLGLPAGITDGRSLTTPDSDRMGQQQANPASGVWPEPPGPRNGSQGLFDKFK